ncbi:MAG: hypothetical protein Q9214_001914 [Letrouitia sp. 1 TL-2023]
MFRARLFHGSDSRVFAAFWLFGLINNVLYVIILSAALDLVGPNVPKSVVLLADVMPSFLVKLCAPYFIHVVPYPLRVTLFVLISTWGMLFIALTPPYTDGDTITTKMAGVILASLSSGAGELSFLGLTHYYGPSSLAAWGSGTGGAGLVGAGAYAVATTSIGLSANTSLLASAFLPVVMLISFFIILPREPLKRKIANRKSGFEGSHIAQRRDGADIENDQSVSDHEDEGLLSNAKVTQSNSALLPSWANSLVQNLRRSRRLILP